MMPDDRYQFAPVNPLRLQVFCLKPEMSYAISERIRARLQPMNLPASVCHADVIDRSPDERKTDVLPDDLRTLPGSIQSP